MARENQNSEKMKKCLEASFYTNVPKIICYTVTMILCMTNVILIFYFGYIFPFYPLNLNFNARRYHFNTCVPKIMITWCTVPEILCATDRRTTNRQMDRWMDGKGENQVVCPNQKETKGQKENIKHYLQVQSINFCMVCRPLSSWQLNFTKYLPEKSLDNIKW